ncbi:MAG: hypothetical protein WAN46_07600 [Gammaproteobacteria bacterium]
MPNNNRVGEFLQRFREALSYWESPVGEYWFCPERITWITAWKIAAWHPSTRHTAASFDADNSRCVICGGCTSAYQEPPPSLAESPKP